jgi:predicted lipoprotein with Yx(FWY)xxD motif
MTHQSQGKRKTMNRIRTVTVLLAPISAIVIAACGGGGSHSTAAPAKASVSGGATHTIDTASTSLGNILVDAGGRTLYLFENDTATKSACSGACAVAWPPLRALGGTAGAELQPSSVGTIKRSDGTVQVTYNGHPLYLFSGDRNPGDVNGQGSTAFGARWFVVSPRGDLISNAAPSSSGGGGRGY